MEADFRRRINNASTKEEADTVRYERYQWECEQEGRSSIPRNEWQETTDRLRFKLLPSYRQSSVTPSAE